MINQLKHVFVDSSDQCSAFATFAYFVSAHCAPFNAICTLNASHSVKYSNGDIAMIEYAYDAVKSNLLGAWAMIKISFFGLHAVISIGVSAIHHIMT